MIFILIFGRGFQKPWEFSKWWEWWCCLNIYNISPWTTSVVLATSFHPHGSVHLVPHTFWNIFCVLPYILSFTFACCIYLLLECKLFKGRHLWFTHRCIQNSAWHRADTQYILTKWIHEWMSEIIWSKLIWTSLMH